ncbi:hypothetical protein DVH05_006445 [Phytophthora capsici]|nr:hypothetical protein DVH05_006445 [Phytophthora capsici]
MTVGSSKLFPTERSYPVGIPLGIQQLHRFLAGLSKAKKRERTPKRASPMSLVMLSRMIAFLEAESIVNETMRVWFSAVCSLCFYGMCRINEVLQMKKGDIQLGLKGRSRKNGAAIRFGCFTIRDRKPDPDPLETKYYACSNSRTTSCKARLICQESGRAHLKGNHLCVTHDEIVSRGVQEEMRQLLEIRSQADLGILSGRVWSNVRDEMISQYGQFSGLRFLPKTDIIKRCRDEATGGDAFRAIE